MLKPVRSAAILLVVLSAAASAQQAAGRWVATWATAGTWRPPFIAAPPAVGSPSATPTAQAPLQSVNQTLRQIVRTSVSGEQVRIVLGNTFGTLPIGVGAAHIGLRAAGATLVEGSTRPLTFAGKPAATIPPGAVLVSDTVAFSVPAMTDLAVDLYLPGNTTTWSSPLTLHTAAFTTNYLSASGNFSGAASFPVATTMTAWWLLTRVEVAAARTARTIVAFGDSITDGTRSTVDTNNRWPDELSRRLRAQPATAHLAVANVAIAGNRLLSEGNPPFGVNALARFDRDVLAQPGAAFVIVLEGINDIGMSRLETRRTADELIGAYRQLIDRAHTHGLEIFGATLTPFEGAGYYDAEGETVRQAVNRWIRTSRAFDAVIDFDVVIRDPAAPTKMRTAFDSGDHLHPNDAGYRAMGQAVDLGIFK